jgi:hypothetical protein
MTDADIVRVAHRLYQKSVKKGLDIPPPLWVATVLINSRLSCGSSLDIGARPWVYRGASTSFKVVAHSSRNGELYLTPDEMLEMLQFERVIIVSFHPRRKTFVAGWGYSEDVKDAAELCEEGDVFGDSPRPIRFTRWRVGDGYLRPLESFHAEGVGWLPMS